MNKQRGNLLPSPCILFYNNIWALEHAMSIGFCQWDAYRFKDAKYTRNIVIKQTNKLMQRSSQISVGWGLSYNFLKKSQIWFYDKHEIHKTFGKFYWLSILVYPLLIIHMAPRKSSLPLLVWYPYKVSSTSYHVIQYRHASCLLLFLMTLYQTLLINNVLFMIVFEHILLGF